MVNRKVLWNELFIYAPDSPTGLLNRINRFGGRGRKAIVAKAGDVAGYVAAHGYSRISYEYREYGTHRVIWEMFNGEIPDGLWVDHIDGDSRNNNIDNLRLVEKRGNSRNRLPRKGRLQGVRMYHYSNSKRAWTSYWSERGKRQQIKYFSIEKLGFARAFEQAIQLRLEKLKYLRTIGDDYTERHTKCLGYPHDLLRECSDEEKEIAVKILESYNLIDWKD